MADIQIASFLNESRRGKPQEYYGFVGFPFYSQFAGAHQQKVGESIGHTGYMSVPLLGTEKMVKFFGKK